MNYEFITVEQKGRVGVITLNRPKQLNALSPALMTELGRALGALDGDAGIGAIVITGNDKAFAAGADISQMKDFSYMHAYLTDYITGWEHFRALRKPVIAAVAGYALGGGNELAMQCDIVIAAENAKFGQPEINLGIIPGYAGTQRLARLTGAGRALELLLTGEHVTAQEAHRLGLVNRVVPAADLMSEARKLAAALASKAPLAVRYIIDAVNKGSQMTLPEAQVFEATLFGLVASTEDMREGTRAFLEKRKPDFKGK